MRPRKVFQFYLCDYSNSNNFYVDINGVVQVTNTPTPLKSSPEGWIGAQLKFSRSTHYFGINKSYTFPLKFVRDGADIIRSIYYTGRGIEQFIQLVVLRWDPATDAYYLFYKGLLDLVKMSDNVQEGVTVNVMEGGVVQLLKAYENAIIEIPVDGSIPENVKVNVDGILFNDVFHYSFINFKASFPGVAVMPAVFQTNDGDNIGVIKNDPTYEQPTTPTFLQTSLNYLMSCITGTTVKITGSVIVEADPAQPSLFYMYTATSLSQPRGVGGLDHAVGMVKQQVPSPADFFKPVVSQVQVAGQQVYNFSFTQTLQPNENLFILFFNQFSTFPITIIGGNFDIAFSTKYKNSRVWGITYYDLCRLLVQNINKLASTSIQTFNFGFDSDLLKQYLRFVVTSGDAARASTDPNYYQYFNQPTLNAANPNNQQFNQYQALGAVLKTSMRDAFDTINAILGASLSNQRLPGKVESLFIENKKYVFDSSVITMVLEEVGDLHISPAGEYFFNWLKIGYPNPQLDEKQGKFEYNTTAQHQAPVKSLAKILELVTKYHTSSYLFEYTRFNVHGGKSTTNNNNDNSVFILNTDFSQFINDFFSADFLSTLLDPVNPNNTNIRLLPNVNMQGLYLPTLDGEYFVTDNTPVIFVFNQNIVSLPFTLHVLFQGIVNGQLTDSATVKMWINGVVVRTWSQNVTGVNTPINITEPAFVNNFSRGDNIYFTIEVTSTCTAQLTAFTLVVSDGSGNYFEADMAGTFDVPAGSAQLLIPLVNVTPRLVSGHPVVSYGFQYFRYIAQLINNDFAALMSVGGYEQGPVLETITFVMYLNGVPYQQFSFPGSIAQVGFANTVEALRTFQLYDLVWILPIVGNLNIQVTNAEVKFTSPSILAYSLLRKIYQNISGIPNPETAYNIEDLTPMRMLLANGDWIRSVLHNLVPDSILFQTLDKNQFLSTTLAGITIKENANTPISSLADPLFYPLLIKFKTKVPVNFSDLFSDAANGHVQVPYLGNTFYGFPIEVTQIASEQNDEQEWTLLASTRNDLSLLKSLAFTGLNPTFLNLMANQFFISHTCPLKFVPLNATQNPQYNFVHMDDDWFINQVNFWLTKKNYFQKFQLNDLIPIQIISNGISSLDLEIYASINNVAILITTVPMNVIAGPLQPPYIQLEAVINPTALGLLPSIAYYVVGKTGAQTPMITEGFTLATKWPVTLLFEFTNSFNKLSTVWSLGFTGAFRVEGWISNFSKDIKATFYEDEPADISLLNSIPYRKFKLNIAAPQGVPDWVWDKVMDIMSLDTVMIDGKQFTLDKGAKPEVKTAEGWPMRFWSIDIREAKNTTGVTISAGGSLVEIPIVTASVDLNAFGENPASGGPNLIQVTES